MPTSYLISPATAPSVVASENAAASCPPWCAGKHDDVEPGITIHVRPVGSLGVEVVAEESGGVIAAPTIYLPVLGGEAGVGDLTPQQAAELAADLTAAVATLDGARI